MSLGMDLSTDTFETVVKELNKSQRKQLLKKLKDYSEILFNTERPGQRKNQR